jgi:hypothetical protein
MYKILRFHSAFSGEFKQTLLCPSYLVVLFVCGATAPPPPKWARASSFTRFIDHTQRRTTVSRTPLDKYSAQHRYLYLTTHTTDIHDPPAVFEPRISAGERSQTHALALAATLPPENKRLPLNRRRLGGPQSRSAQVRKISPLPGFDPRTVQPVASCYAD